MVQAALKNLPKPAPKPIVRENPIELKDELKEEINKLLVVDIQAVRARTDAEHKAAFKSLERLTKPEGRRLAET